VSEIQVISGTRRAIKEMADGTIRVQIDIDPACRSAFWSLFPSIDMPVAIAPLVADFEQREPGSEKPKDGYGEHYAVLYKSGWFHNPKVVTAFDVSMDLPPAERIEAIKDEIYGAFDVDSLAKIKPEKFSKWCCELSIGSTLPAAFGAA
jgi:hypothetical protein